MRSRPGLRPLRPKGSAAPSNRVEDGRRVLRRRLLPDEVPGVEDHEAAVRQPLVEELLVGERDDAVVAAVDDRDRRRDLRQQLGELGQLLGIACGRSASTRRSGRRRSSPGSPRGSRRASRPRSCPPPRRRSRAGPSGGTCRGRGRAPTPRAGHRAGAGPQLRRCPRSGSRSAPDAPRPRTGRPRSRRRARRCAAVPSSTSAISWARKSPIARGDRRSSRRSDAPNPGRSMANRRACSASVAQIGANAYTLSGQGLVSRMVRSCEPPLSAYRIRTPSTARNWTSGVRGHRHATKTPFSGRPSRPWIPGIDLGPVRYAHLLHGEVHCTSNVLRDPSGAAPWWSAS